MTIDDISVETKLAIIKAYLIDKPDRVEYVAITAALEGIYGHLRKFGMDEEQLAPLVQPITQMIEENVKAKKIAADAQRLITEFKTLLAAKEDAYIKRVESLLDENIQSGNTGTRMLALTLLNKMKATKD